ncbi:MAG: DUF2520 domain-containing protein [Proteobacteria bacterium]|nr:DUF2520 domain-containing protein [Pseudomonadota bacterium]
MKNKLLQKPFLPLLIGSGRLARHLGRYFELMGAPHLVWDRPRTPPPSDLTTRATHFWVLVRDEALPALCSSLLSDHPHTPILHSSAATCIPEAMTAHPLMTFGPEPYPLAQYQKIPFTVIEEEAAHDPDAISFLKDTLGNPVHFIRQKERLHYHAAAVMISNFSMLLWEAALSGASPDSLPPRQAFEPILEQSLANFMEHGSKALTGPLARGDESVVRAHLDALGASPAQELYRSFVDYFNATRKEDES